VTFPHIHDTATDDLPTLRVARIVVTPGRTSRRSMPLPGSRSAVAEEVEAADYSDVPKPGGAEAGTIAMAAVARQSRSPGRAGDRVECVGLDRPTVRT
jgi:hypothetical protein